MKVVPKYKDHWLPLKATTSCKGNRLDGKALAAVGAVLGGTYNVTCALDPSRSWGHIDDEMASKSLADRARKPIKLALRV